MPGFARVSRASVKELRDRVGSVKNTKKITSAMKLVAAAKVRRAQDAVLKTHPFSETLQKVLGGLIVRLKKDNFDSPLMQDRPVKKVCCLYSPWHTVVVVVPCVLSTPAATDFVASIKCSWSLSGGNGMREWQFNTRKGHDVIVARCADERACMASLVRIFSQSCEFALPAYFSTYVRSDLHWH